MISLMTVYDAFLARVNDDEWSQYYTEEDLEWYKRDWRSLLDSAITYFKFPRCNLDIDETKQVFSDEAMTMQEVQVLACFMKQEWLKRTVNSWENVKTQYEEKDFSQANLLKSFISLLDQATEDAQYAESAYYRSEGKKPFNYRKLYGKQM